MGEINFVPLPPGQLTVPANADMSFPVRGNDWKRIQLHVASLKPRMPGLSSAAWAFFGIGVSALLGLITWSPAEAQLVATSKAEFAFVSPLLGVIGIATLVVALAFFLVDHQLRKDVGRSAVEIVEEMEEIYRPFKDVQPLAVLSEPEPSNDKSQQTERSAIGITLTEADRISVKRGADSVARYFERTAHVDNSNMTLKQGDRIRHNSFGVGIVAAVTGDGAKRVAEVYFADVGRKRLLIKVAPIELLP